MQQNLLGRQPVLAALRNAMLGAAEGRGGLVLVAGEPGIGKTALVSHAVGELGRPDIELLWATCWDGAGAPAYWPWVQVIREHARTCDPQTFRDQLGPGAGEVARLVEDVAAITKGPPAREDPDPDRARFRLFDAVGSMLSRAAANRPLWWSSTTSNGLTRRRCCC